MSTTIVGYRLVEKTEKIQAGDVCGYAKKYPIDMANWQDALAGDFNQAVFRPMKCFEDYNDYK